MFFLLNILAFVSLFATAFGISPSLVKFYCSRGGTWGIRLNVVDINGLNGRIDWETFRNGCSFVYFEAAPTGYKFAERLALESTAAKKAGVLYYGIWQDALDFTKYSGADFANNLASNGTAIGATLPGVINIDDSILHVNYCGGLDVTSMVKWMQDFSKTYKDKTGRYPVIATQPQWWNSCTNKNTEFGRTSPWWNLSDKFTHRGDATSPAGWANYTFNGGEPGTVFNGDEASLKSFAAQSSSG